MSHVVTVSVQMQDEAAIKVAAGQMVGVRVLERGRYELFNTKAEGLGIQLPGWKYPVVVGAGGVIKYDNYEGNWGEQAQLDDLLYRYSKEATRSAAIAQGYSVTEEEVEDGVKLVLSDYS